MSEQTVEFQARIYVYDLQNCAREFGFKAGEAWEVGPVSSEEKAAIEKKYFPTLSARVLPEMLTEMLGSVIFKLSQQPAEKEMDMTHIRQRRLEYLVAYNPDRLRR